MLLGVSSKTAFRLFGCSHEVQEFLAFVVLSTMITTIGRSHLLVPCAIAIAMAMAMAFAIKKMVITSITIRMENITITIMKVMIVDTITIMTMTMAGLIVGMTEIVQLICPHHHTRPTTPATL